MKNVSSIYEIRSVLRSINANMNIAIENHNYNLFPKSGLLEMINKIRENENSNQKNETSDLRLQLIFLTVINSTYNSIFDRVLKNDEGIIEFMIFKLCVFKNSLEKNFKNETELIQEFNNLFYTFLKDALPEMDEEFMRNRYLFYIEVFKLMENTFDWLPATVQILFFSSPLIDEPKEPTVFNNLEELIHFQYQLKILKRGMENFLSLVVNEIPIKN